MFVMLPAAVSAIAVLRGGWLSLFLAQWRRHRTRRNVVHHAACRADMDRTILFGDVERPIKFVWARAIKGSTSALICVRRMFLISVGD